MNGLESFEYWFRNINWNVREVFRVGHDFSGVYITGFQGKSCPIASLIVLNVL
jgi:hypothetical protein